MIRERKFEFITPYSWLDFLNTEFTKTDRGPLDALRDLTDVIEWLREAGLIDRKQAQHAVAASGRGEARECVYQSALALRRALRTLAEHLADRRPVPR